MLQLKDLWFPRFCNKPGGMFMFPESWQVPSFIILHVSDETCSNVTPVVKTRRPSGYAPFIMRCSITVAVKCPISRFPGLKSNWYCVSRSGLLTPLGVIILCAQT